MADAPQPRPRRDVIPLHPGRAADPTPPRWPAALRAAMRRVRAAAKLAALLRVNARGVLDFLAPALLLSVGAALLALLAGSVATALGMEGVSVGAVAATAGRWTLLASAGGALARRGATLARTRWR